MEELLAIIKQQATTIDVMTNELALLREQVDWLMKGFSISPKINVSKSRDFY